MTRLLIGLLALGALAMAGCGVDGEPERPAALSADATRVA
tara:strand:- start:556 stop:675 length:120 start_codon:yes stop_codon:yes gene_type:complete